MGELAVQVEGMSVKGVGWNRLAGLVKEWLGTAGRSKKVKLPRRQLKKRFWIFF